MRLRTRSRAQLFSTVALAAGFAATLDCSFTPAMAQGFFFWSGDSLPRAAPRETRHVARPRHAGGKKTSPTAGDKTGATPAREAKADTPQLDRPLFLIASIADQHVSIYNHHGLVVRSAISTGMAGHPTPKGIFSIIGRERFHRSNIYSGAPMPFMQRITWSGVAMHLGVVPGHPASHGCIRLPAAFAAKLWGMTRIGERVVISPQDVSPVEFQHTLLPQAKLRTSAESEKSGSGAQVAATPASAALPPMSERPEIKTGGDAAGAAKADPAADQKPSPAVAEATAGIPQPQAQQPKVEAAPAAAAKPEPAAVEAQKEASVAADAPAANPARPAEQPKIEAGADKAEPSVGAPPSAVAEPLMINPHQYAQQLKAKAVAEAAAAVKAVKALTLEVVTKQKEAARAAAELNAAEASLSWARNKADAAAATYDAVTASAASQREPAETAERDASSGDAPAKAKADRLTTAYGRTLLVQDAALLAKTNADSVLAEASAKLEQARTALNASESEFADVDRRLDEARTAASTAVAAQKDAERRAAPISMLISKKEGRIYVRQGLAPLFDAPVDIRDPKTPLGSHLYVATAPSDDGKSLKWHVVSMPVHLGDEPVSRRKTASNEAGMSSGMSWSLRTTTSPTEALERIDIPKDVRDRIGDRLWTGASLIISDQPVSNETGAVGTDLTIKLR